MNQLRGVIEAIPESVPVARAMLRDFGEENGIVDYEYTPHLAQPIEILHNTVQFYSFLQKVTSCEHSTCTAFEIDERFSKLISTMGA